MGGDTGGSDASDRGDGVSPIGADSGSRPDEERDSGQDSRREYQRDLGVVEAITAVTRSCPNGGVVLAAERALEAIKKGGAGVMKQQAYFVLVAIRGWRGDRAEQVHRSLTRYLEPTDAGADDPAPGDP